MKSIYGRLSILGMIILFFSGCALIGPVDSSSEITPMEEPAKHPTTDEASESSYYYFTEAQLQKNKGNLEKAIRLIKKAIEKDDRSLFLKKELTLLYLQQRENEKALNTINNIIEIDPNNVQALIIYAKIKQNLKEIAAAENVYEKIIFLDPKQRNIYLVLGGLYMNEENFEKASKIYQGLVQHFPDDYVGHFFLGRIYAKKGDLIEAEMEFQRAIALEPGLDEARFELIELFKITDKEEQAIQTYREILKNNPHNVRSAMDLGYLYHQKGMETLSAQIFKELGRRSASDAEIFRNVVQLYLDQKKYDAAIVILNGMVAGAPDSSEIHYLLGAAFDGKGDEEMAIRHLQRVDSTSEFYQNAAIRMAFIYNDLGKIKKAIHLLEGVNQKVPPTPELLLYLGTFYEETEAFHKAIDVLEKGLVKDPNNARILFRLGVVYDKLERKKDSMEAMKKVIRVDPNNANALNYLGYTYADMGKNLNEAEQLIKRALKYKPDDGYITDSLGWVYYKKGLFQKALKFLEKAIRLVPDDPVILEHLGDTYLKIGGKKKALEYYRRSLQMKKNNREEIEKKIQELQAPESSLFTPADTSGLGSHGDETFFI